MNEARATLTSRARTFRWAGRLLSEAQLDDAATLYAFCRYVDDVADDALDTKEMQAARDELAAIDAELESGTSKRLEVEPFLRMARRLNTNLRIPRVLVQTLQGDIGPRHVGSTEELLHYAYGVASTVGLMMCDVLGVDDPRARPFAIDLGIGMQLTNICRDVAEDAERGRTYLPSDLIAAHNEPFPHPHTTRRILWLAQRYYRSADAGLRYLPLRARLAIITASRCYEAIGTRILKGTSRWPERVHVGQFEKTARTVMALAQCTIDRTYHQSGPHPEHDPALHVAIADLPGAHA